MKTIVITHAVRTPIGKIGGSLKDISEKELGKLIIKELIENRAELDKSLLDQVIIGQVKQSSNPANIARYISLSAGIPENVPAYTVHRQCGSGLQAIMDAFTMISCGEANVILAGGVENMSQSVYFMRNTRNGLGNGNYLIEDSLVQGGPGSIPEHTYGSIPMGITAENLAKDYQISREEQDLFSLSSQEKTNKAISEGRFIEQIVSIKTADTIFSTDEHPFLAPLEKLGTLRPSFKKDGSVTAGNSSGRNDGAAAVLVMTQEEALKLGKTPLVKITAAASSGCEPQTMGLGPVECTRLALEKANLSLSQIDVIELNEAFAAQSIAVLKEWEKFGVSYDQLLEKVNPNGGAIALGHPLGCTGAALVVKCIYELLRVTEKKYGLITLCCAGGLGVALIIEKCQR